jgi:hypothetical protein
MPERRWGSWEWEADDAPTTVVCDIDEGALTRMIDLRIARMGGELAVAVDRHIRRTLDLLRGRVVDDD